MAPSQLLERIKEDVHKANGAGTETDHSDHEDHTDHTDDMNNGW